MNQITKAAILLGSLGGKSTSPAKQAASRENGKRGGRPAKRGDFTAKDVTPKGTIDHPGQDNEPETPRRECAFCYPREQGTHGEVKREWSPEWSQFILVCRKHALADGMDKDGISAPYTAEDGIINDD